MGFCSGQNLLNVMKVDDPLVPVFLQYQLEGHQESCSKGKSLSLAECMGFEPETFQF